LFFRRLRWKRPSTEVWGAAIFPRPAALFYGTEGDEREISEIFNVGVQAETRLDLRAILKEKAASLRWRRDREVLTEPGYNPGDSWL
jgi:hypothetical protein